MKNSLQNRSKGIIGSKYVFVFSFLGLLLFNSCQKEGCIDPLANNYSSEAELDDGTCAYDSINNPNPNPNPTGCTVIQAGSGISTPTVWTAGNVYVITGEFTVNSILTINPGVIIKLNINGRIRVNSGKIMAQGTSTQRIVFTSYADDSYCGDTNGDGTATSPLKGDWLNVYLNGGNGNTFEYCDFLYAGANDSGYRSAVNISISGASFTFDHCVFAHTQSGANFTQQFAFYAGSYMADPTISVFTNNVFYDNNVPIYLNGSYSINTNNSYSNPNNPTQKNAKNGIWMYPSGGSNVAAFYSETEVCYVMDGGMTKANGSLTIGNGVVVKFPQGNTNGLNVANLNLSSGAFLTSLKDDAHGGDTNGDGNASSPAASDWNGCWNWSNSVWVTGANVLYSAN